MVMAVALAVIPQASKTHRGEATNSKNITRMRKTVVRLPENLRRCRVRELPRVFEPLHLIPSREMLRFRKSLSKIFSTLATNQGQRQVRMARL